MVRIPPSAVLSYKNAPAIPPSCLCVSRVNESRRNGIPYVTIPIPLDQTGEDPEFTLAFALSVQMSAIPSIMNSIETHLTLTQDPWTGQQVVWLSAEPTPGLCPPRNILGRKRRRLATLSSTHPWIHSRLLLRQSRSRTANGTSTVYWSIYPQSDLQVSSRPSDSTGVT